MAERGFKAGNPVFTEPDKLMTLFHSMFQNPQFEAYKRALSMIYPEFLNTPQYEVESLQEIADCRIIAKVECLNPIRSFKGRGACCLVSAIPQHHLVCASAGNFGQAMAYACRKKDAHLIVYASTNSNRLKVERMQALGAEVRLFGNDFDAAKLEARRYAEQSGARLIEDSAEPPSWEGAGTIGLELLKLEINLDTVLIALGNGALAVGIGEVIKTCLPQTRVIAVGAVGAPAMAESFKKRKVVESPQVKTIADGIAVRIPIPAIVEKMQRCIDDVLLVDDQSTIRAMKLIHTNLGLVVEPSAAVGLAAILENKDRFQDQTIATVLCGGNLTKEQIQCWLT